MSQTVASTIRSHAFSMVPQAHIQRSVFDRSHGVKTAFDSGLLIPIYIDEVLPGDTFHGSISLLGRLSTPIVPFMDNVWMDTFFFFVPNRLVWDHWKNFMGEQKNPGDSIDYLIPASTTPTGGCPRGSVADYFGIPTGVAGVTGINELPFRAYNLIYNEFFRDENLCPSRDVFTDDSGHVDYLSMMPARRGKRHDYFTSALPWTQKGPDVQMPIGDSAPVYSVDYRSSLWSSAGSAVASDNSVLYSRGSGMIGISGSSTYYRLAPNRENDSSSVLRADLSNALSAPINSIREAFQVQKFLETCARGGTRYTELLRAHFGVISPDARLQRPEYLGGGTSRISINTVAQTSATNTVTPQGNLAAFGLVSGQNNAFHKSFTEHGYIIGLVSVRADLTYQQGLNRLWSRTDRNSFYWPSFAHLGEQAILNKEIYAQGTSTDNEVFGYQERYAEYRYHPSIITGKLRSTDSQSLDVWHLAQKFDSLPTLNQDFIEEHPPLNRVLATQDEPQIILDSWMNLKCVRPMPVFGVPGFVDHF